MKTQQTQIKDNKTPESDNQRNETRAGQNPQHNAILAKHIYGENSPEHKMMVEAAAPAQAQHSPLPWKVSDSKPPKIIIAGRPGFIATLGYPHEGDREANADFIVRACNNAQRLADALANLARPLTEGWKVSDMDVRIREAREALAEWEQAQ